MAEFEWGFEHKFSKLGTLQEEMCLQYKATVQTNGVEFSIAKQDRTGTVYKCRTLKGISAQQGKQLVTFLYENAVPLETWQDVLEEAYQRIKQY